MPDPHVHEQKRPRRAHHVLLTQNILVTTNARLTHHTQMSTGNEAGPPHLHRHFMGEVHDLDIKGLAWINGRILVGMLRDRRITLVVGGRESDMQEMVVKHWRPAHEGLNGTSNLRQCQQTGKC